MFIATARDKKLDFGTETSRAKFLEWLEQNEGKKIKLEPVKAKRSNPQNAYLWGVVYETISHDTGHTAEELHEIYKRMFLKPKYIEYNGKEIKVPASTTNLNKIEFGEYLERIFAEAGNLGIHVPTPDEAGYVSDFDLKYKLKTKRVLVK